MVQKSILAANSTATTDSFSQATSLNSDGLPRKTGYKYKSLKLQLGSHALLARAP